MHGALSPEPVRVMGAPREPRPRVLVVVPRLAPEVYGGTRSILLAVAHFRNARPVVLLAGRISGDPVVEELAAAGVEHRVADLPAPRGRGRLQRALHLLDWNRMAAAHIREVAPDVVHVDAEWFFHVAPAARRLGVPVVHHLRGIQPSGTVRWFRQAALLMARHNLAISDSLRDFYLRGTHPALRARVEPALSTVYNPFVLEAADRALDETPRHAARAELGIAPDERAVAVVGAVWSAKGQLPFLEQVAPAVAAADPRVRFHIVGGSRDDAYHARCAEAARASGLEGRVVLHGYRADIRRWYRAIDVLALPSLREGFGRVAVEAQAFGVPVVAADIVGVRDALADGVGGFLVRTPDEWTGALLRLCQDESLRAAVGERGRAWVRRFDAPAVTRQLEEVYASVA